MPSQEQLFPKRGEVWRDVNRSDTVRVMADPIEGYVMVRYKGATPFLVHISDWKVRFLRFQT
jgi:hypothetical protein